MAFTKDEKTKMMAQYQTWISKSSAVFLVEYNKMTQKEVDTAIEAVADALQDLTPHAAEVAPHLVVA